jgi:sulfate transport system permease protein
MAGPGTSQELLAEIASRPGRDTVVSFVVKAAFITTSLLFLAALLFAPLITVFATALEKGFELYFDSFKDSDTLAAIRLTLMVAAIVVPLNIVFGIAASWAIAKFEFKGKSATSASSSRCLASCSRPCSSRSRTSRAS